MSVELTYLVYTIALFFVVVMAQATTGILNNGALAMANSRDNLKPPTVMQARMKRLTDNFRENLWFFVPLVLIAAVSGISNQWTVLGAQIFFFSRLLHAAWYAFGWPIVRPLFWFAGVIACGLIFLALFGILT
ncbi:MAG TPA: MAPEG family protein [Vitreimonas sp.]|uniref:MAPEG family protein n=1 Tax=Vitreimonas sp. TaxID=3069702 RepID=UPI002D54364F|nr:MAPEG family protein [Vitreimonas sp.]HYD87480.1 MAPEG family protein [Vitreimonas sp.]